MSRSLLLAVLACALVATCTASKGHGVHHLTDASFAEKTGDGKASFGFSCMIAGICTEPGWPQQRCPALPIAWGLLPPPPPTCRLLRNPSPTSQPGPLLPLLD